MINPLDKKIGREIIGEGEGKNIWKSSLDWIFRSRVQMSVTKADGWMDTYDVTL